MESDNINHPKHYTTYKGIEVIQLTEQMNFNRGNAVKYISRAGLKSPETELEDLKKALWYIEREIKRISPVEETEPSEDFLMDAKHERIHFLIGSAAQNIVIDTDFKKSVDTALASDEVTRSILGIEDDGSTPWPYHEVYGWVSFLLSKRHCDAKFGRTVNPEVIKEDLTHVVSRISDFV